MVCGETSKRTARSSTVTRPDLLGDFEDAVLSGSEHAELGFVSFG